jgi:hypothetical protein
MLQVHSSQLSLEFHHHHHRNHHLIDYQSTILLVGLLLLGLLRFPNKQSNSIDFEEITEENAFMETCLLLEKRIPQISECVHKRIEWVSVRSFWNGRKRIPSK